jgi:hypothetical protein
MAKRLFFSIIFGGCLVLAAHLIFELLPVAIFPCVQTQIGGITSKQVCSLGDVYSSRSGAVYQLTTIGQVSSFIIIYVLPVIAGFCLEFRLLARLKGVL